MPYDKNIKPKNTDSLLREVPKDADSSANVDNTFREQSSKFSAEINNEDGMTFQKNKRTLKKRMPLEYHLKDMYPELGLLTAAARREWDYGDPELIRALWLETRTNALDEWRIRNAKIKRRREPTIAVHGTKTTKLRLEHKRKKEGVHYEREKGLFSSGWRPVYRSPKFLPVQVANNTTNELRINYKRNNPNVPHYYIEHFHKYKRPPFKTFSHLHRI